MSVPEPREPNHDGRWETVRYALDSNARTFRFCLIWFVVIVSPVVATVITLLLRHMLLLYAACVLGPGELTEPPGLAASVLRWPRGRAH